MSTMFGGPAEPQGVPSPGGYLGGGPEQKSTPAALDKDASDREKLVAWSQDAAGTLKRERQKITDEIKAAIALQRGETPWWRNRPKWKIGTRLNKCMTVPATWAAILSDSEPAVTYSSYRTEGQRTADIMTSAFRTAYDENGWQRKIRDAIFVSRVQKKAFLRLTPDTLGGKAKANLAVVPAIQVYVDRNATCIDDAEVILYEYRESFGKIIARFPDIEEDLRKKYTDNTDQDDKTGKEILAPPASLALPSGSTIFNPPYAAAANPPDDAGGTSGLLIQEFWTRPHRMVEVNTPLFTAAGEPATVPLYIEYDDGETELMRRVITEGNVVYELPVSIVDGLKELEIFGGIRILDEQDAYELCMHKVEVPLYPDGRLLVVVDTSQIPDNGDMLNPLGYMPFVEIEAYADPMQFYGQSDVDLIKDAYEYLIRLVSSLLDAANLSSNPLWRVWEGEQLSNDDFTNAPAAIQRESINSLKYSKREAGPEMPNYVMNLIRFMLEQIDDLSGLTPAAQGKTPPKAQQSTDTAQMMQEASGVRFRDAQRSLKTAMVKLGQQFQELVTRYYNEPVIVQIKNDMGDNEAAPLLGSHLTETFKIEAKPGSMMSATPSARLSTMLNLLNSGQPLVDLPEIWQLLASVGLIDSATSIERRIAKERKDPNSMWLVPGATPKPPQQSKKPNGKRAKNASTQGVG